MANHPRDLMGDLEERTESFRQRIIPWLQASIPLSQARILEIGCGSGCSTLTLAEAGAQVTAVDIDRPALALAEQRCQDGGFADRVDFFVANAVEVGDRFAEESFDVIIFFACLEHMTHEERLAAMRTTWQMLPVGGFWCLIDTPNRLWYYDAHTSLLPFYSWLPHRLAFEYAQFSPRQDFCDVLSQFSGYDDEAYTMLMRLGRGLSFHEFELAMGRLDSLEIVSDLASFLLGKEFSESRKRPPLWQQFKAIVPLRLKMLLKGATSTESLATDKYLDFLITAAPQLHPGFLRPSLDMIFRKF
ncbi:class I SAM-dependent methyltransferase [bacterium]|nr:class I SAM-dependent methyltransferase [bacterium]